MSIPNLSSNVLSNAGVRKLLNDYQSLRIGNMKLRSERDSLAEEAKLEKRRANKVERELSKDFHPMADALLGLTGASGGAALDSLVERIPMVGPIAKALPINSSEVAGLAAMGLGWYFDDMRWLFELGEGPVYAAQYARSKKVADAGFDAAALLWASMGT